MTIPIKIPVTARPRQTATQFHAHFNVPTVNVYDFGDPANVDIPIMPMKKPSIYLLTGISFSCDIPEGTFKSAINTIPTLQLNLLSTKVQIFPDPIPFINYVDSQEYVYFFNSQIQPDSLIGTFTGILNQPPPLVGDLIIYAQVQLNI